MLARWPAPRRRRVATIAAVVAILVATLVASSRLLRLVFPDLDPLAYLGLFVACWIGAGGALVPIPGVRPISWFMIVQQGAALDPVTVALIGALAMVLGQTSYFLAARATSSRRARSVGAEEPEGPPGEAPVEHVDARPIPDGGTSGRRSRSFERARQRVERQVRTHGMVTVFTVCALPSPLTTLTTTAASTSGMGYVRFFPASFGGYLVLCSLLALFGQGLLLAVQSVVPVP